MRKHRITTALFITALPVLALTACSPGQPTSFSTRAEAMSSDLAERGWIPSELPADATGIAVRYTTDSNEQLVTWTGSALDTACEETTAADEEVLRGGPDALDTDSAQRCLDGYASSDGTANVYWAPPR